MTEHTRIPIPGEPEKDEGQSEKDTRRSSLLERASGAFGLDDFGPAPMPGKLNQRPMKRARPVARKDAGDIGSQAPDAEPGKADRLDEDPGPTLPATRQTAAPKVVEARTNLPAFSGDAIAIDRDRLRARGLIDPEGGASALLEEFRIVKRNVLGAARERGTAASRRILVSSPHADEGKTYCALNLAIALAAERDLEVLLVDADFAKPSIAGALGLSRQAGFMDALSDDSLRVEELVQRTDIGNLWVLQSGSQTTADTEYLASSRTADILDGLTLGRPDRVVIFDTPPALAASPAAELAKHAGQSILVARADQTGRSALEDAYHLLSACEDIKLILNATNFSPSGRRFGSYYE